MGSARVLIEVTAGVVPGRAEVELTKRWAVTSAEWYEDAAKQGELLSTRNGMALGYAGWLMMQPDRVNWVKTDWIWL
jgi:hypothetical protein